ncbi:Cell division cycle-associated 7 protein [Spatholobus suberectus]|nr:Cell division cycle-associated 7 protein [Spatholobus suberectus]
MPSMQKTLGEHTSCNKCELLQGQFCGDCLYTRYGETVLEANNKAKWTCPPCRGICNCSRCRRGKGWMPTGNIYNKVSKLGFKSVAHYLIKTRRSELLLEGSGAENIVAKEISETSADTTLNRQLAVARGGP